MLMPIRSAIFMIGKIIVTLLYGIILVVIAPFPDRLRHKIVTYWCWLVVHWLRLTCGVRFKTSGMENLKLNEGAKVYLAKHESAWETFFLQSLLFPAATVYKKELLRIPIFGWGLSYMHPIAIDRSSPRDALKKVKQGGIERISNGINLLLFPEGTRVAPGETGKYARSGADIAVSTGVDVVPIAVNAGHCWLRKTYLKKPGLITVAVGPAISTAGKDSRTVIQEVETWIETRMQQLRDQEE